MNKLFRPDSLRILESLSFTRTLYAFDFDGTLSRIVRNPRDAVIRPAVEILLRELSGHAPVAIISGRSIADLKKHLGFIPPYLVGNHGLERLGARPDSANSPNSGDALERTHEICVGWKRRLEKRLVRGPARPGLEIEDKSYSIAIHYRKCARKKEAKLDVLSAVAELNPKPRVIQGKCVVNILPPGAPHKGMALAELMLEVGARSAFYIGDDSTDEDVFSLPDARILSVRVGKKKTSRAQYFIEEQSEITRVLKTILRFHRSERKVEWSHRTDPDIPSNPLSI